MNSPEEPPQRWTLDELLKALGPTVIHPLAKQRTKLLVLEHAAWRSPRASRWLAATVLVASSAAAAATLQHLTTNGPSTAEHELPPRVVHGATPAARRGPIRPQPKLSATANGAPIPMAVAPTTATTRGRPTEVAARTPARVEARGGAKTPSARGAKETRRTTALPSSEDPTQVAQALRALRKDGRPEQAQTLLTRYLSENPDGALAEEALALSIEAALKRNPARATSYARQYLKRFPQGRFRPLAQRALNSSR